jgi:DNA-binding transcriptional LysR family regulator
MAEGLEPELSAVVDVMYPMAALTRAVSFFTQTYPRTPLRLYVEALGAVVQAVLDGRCRVGVIGSLPLVPENVASEPLMEVPLATVVAPRHPLAQVRGVVPKALLVDHVQLVLTDRSTLSEGRNFGVVSPLIWRLADLGAKLEFLKAGFGWGHMPLPMIEEALAAKQLVKIRIAGASDSARMPMHAVYHFEASVLADPCGSFGDLNRVVAAVDKQVRAGHEARRVGGEEQRRGGDLVGHP